jgi:hypothetical protein
MGRTKGVGGQLRQRHAVGRGARADGVERDVETARSLDHGAEVLVDGLLVEGVDLGRLGDAAGSHDLFGDGIDLRHVASCQEEPRSFACEGAGDGAADRTPGGIDDGSLVLKQHVGSDTGGGENGTAGPFRDEPVSLPVMTATEQADARSSCRATR